LMNAELVVMHSTDFFLMLELRIQVFSFASLSG